MNSEKITSKFIYFGAIIGMCSILVFLTYNFFLRTIRVDVMKDIVFTYTGESGNASVSAVNGSDDINKRTQAFLDTVTYEIEPSENLSNGDMIHVTASFSESIASQYHFQAKNVEKDFEVEGLNYRYETLEDVNPLFIERVINASQKYLEDNEEEIRELYVPYKEGEFVEAQIVYKSFMKSKSQEITDRIIVVYKMVYQLNEEEQKIIYYTITVPEINDGNQISNDIFGEKAYLTEEETLNENIDGYIHRLYESQFEIYEIVDPVEEEIEKVDETETEEQGETEE